MSKFAWFFIFILDASLCDVKLEFLFKIEIEKFQKES